jgi:hypothetical protein
MASSYPSLSVEVVPFDAVWNISDAYARGGYWLSPGENKTSWGEVLTIMLDELRAIHNDPVVVALVTCYCVIFLLALVGNLLVLIVTMASGGLRNVTNSFLLNLSLADLLGEHDYIYTNYTIHDKYIMVIFFTK